MPAAPSKSATPAAGTRAERATARDDRTEGRIAGIDTSMADPVEQLQRIAGNTAVSTLAALRNPGSTGGEPLPDQLRGELETRFGEDFEGVRIHADGRAADAAAALHAKAYTLGENIVFGVRRFAPETFEGRRLLAHELAHVVQQRRGGGLPELRQGSALELAADQAALSVATGAGPVAVNGAAGIGIARETDEDEIDKALSTWTKLDQQTEEEARRKPGPPPKRDTTTATTNPPPKADAVDPTLRDGHALREQRQELLRQREEARKRGEDPAAIKPKPPVVDIDKYRDAVRAATQKQSEDEIKRHADAVSKQPAMTHEDMFNKTLAMRGFDAGASVWDRERLQNDYDALKKQLQTHPDAPAIDAFHDQNKKLKTEIAKLDRSARKQGKLSTEDQERLDKLKQTLASNTATIEASPVTALRQRASSLHDKLAISGLRDPDAPKGSSGKAAASKGAPAGRGENTYAILQIIGPDGKIVAWGAGKNTAEGHAEENALLQIRRQIKGMPNGLPPGSRVEVVGDQVVCSEICKPALAKFAEEHHVESVDGYTFHAVKPGGGGQPKAGSVLSAKTTAKDATTEAASGWALQRKHEPIYRAGTGIIGGGAPTAGEVHRQARKEKQRRAQKAARKTQPTPAAGAKGPPTDAKATRRQTKRAATSAAAPRGPKTRSGNPAAALPGSRARGSKPEPAGKAPPAKADAAKTPRRTRANPTGSATKTTAPATRATAAPRRRGQTKTPTVPPPAPKHTELRPPQSAPRADAGKLAGGAAVTASPAAQAVRSRQSRAAAQSPQAQTLTQAPAPSAAKRAPPPTAATPAGQPPASSPPQVRRSTEITRGGGAFLAPGTAGGRA
ncbi:MAG: DUF4157 domain-containing protein, partial [Alphaproteobacteria bacterium]|nr:DUF4157 domain-containing protein [Alphaproteobacteria bacterium]